jgi:hypothetical protein
VTREVQATYTFVVEVGDDQSVEEAVEEHVHSVGAAFGSPDKVEEVPGLCEPVCSRCGKPRSEDAHGILTDVQVVTADGEEGFADVTQLLCNEDLEEVLGGLRALGFKDHRHGGINYLEDDDCPGWGKCPTPHDEEHGFDPYRESIILGQPR